MNADGVQAVPVYEGGGPFAHRERDGRCTVCGAIGDQLARLGCPIGVDWDALERLPAGRLTSGVELRRAVRAMSGRDEDDAPP